MILKTNNISSWANIDDIETNKPQFNINYEYCLSTGTKQYLYYYDIIADTYDEGEDEELIIAKIKYDNKSKILSKNKNYKRYVRLIDECEYCAL